jgi:hypothetical protein
VISLLVDISSFRAVDFPLISLFTIADRHRPSIKIEEPSTGQEFVE